MNEEEKKAVKFFYNLRATIDESNMLFDEEINVKHGKETIKQITTILNLIEKLQKENEELKLYNNSITSQLEQMTTEKFKEGWIHKSEFKDFIPVQKVKDKIKEILKNGEYRIIFEGDAEFPDEATIITAQKYLKLEKV